MSRLGIGLLWLLWRLLPVRALGLAGEGLGALAYYLVGSRRRVGATNLRLCFPNMPAEARTRLLKRHFRLLGRAFLQETETWWGSQDRLEALVRIDNPQALEAHLGKPLILFAPHFIGINLGGLRLCTLQCNPVTVYSPLRNPDLDRIVSQARHRFGPVTTFARSEGIKPVLRAVKAGRPFHYSPDLDLGRRDSIFVPFFGVQAATVSGLARVARATNATVIPYVTRWQQDGYAVHIHPAWEHFPSGDMEADTRRMNAFIEECVREMPEQYFWVHRRFKTRPPGETRLYERN